MTPRHARSRRTPRQTRIEKRLPRIPPPPQRVLAIPDAALRTMKQSFSAAPRHNRRPRPRNIPRWQPRNTLKIPQTIPSGGHAEIQTSITPPSDPGDTTPIDIQNEAYTIIRSDPGIVARERWYLRTTPQWSAFIDSLSDPEVPYTTDMLTEIYQSRILRADTGPIIQHPAFNPGLLEEKFDRDFKYAVRGQQLDQLATELASPNARDAWFEKGH